MRTYMFIQNENIYYKNTLVRMPSNEIKRNNIFKLSKGILFGALDADPPKNTEDRRNNLNFSDKNEI